MVYVQGDDLNKIWRCSMKGIFEGGRVSSDSRYYKIETLVIEMEKAALSEPDSAFPVSKKDIEVINHYIVSGENEDKVCHEWTKLYYHRLFDEPNSQIGYIFDRVKQGKVGIAGNWHKTDQHSKIKPCMLLITVSNESGKLNFQLHARACNVYNKLLMNLQEFVTLQTYLASGLDLELGRFAMFIDYAQISKEDCDKVRGLI